MKKDYKMDKTNKNSNESSDIKSADANFLNKLEKEGEANAKVIVKDLLNTGNIDVAKKNIENVLQAGFDAFKKETGRNMTYSEMRDLYG